MPIRKSSISGIPFGQNTGRPQSPSFGQPFFNGDASRLELYTTANGWQNIVQEVPAVIGISGAYYEGSTTNTLTISGTNFLSGASAYAVGSNGVEINALTTTVVSIVQISATFSGLSPAYEPYDIKVVNPSNLYGIMYRVLQIDNVPVWSTQSGTLGTYIEQSPMSVSPVATDQELQALTYSVISGSLPGGLSLNSSTGVISGTPADIIPNTTYSFVLGASDGHNLSTRNFSISIVDRGPSWSTTSPLTSFAKAVAYSTNLLAVDDNSGTVSYSLVSGSLPAGLSLSSSGVISGTSTSSLSSTFTVRATDPSGNYTDKQFTLPNTGPSWVTPSGALTDATQGSAYSKQLSATDDSTTVSVSYSLVSGTLPAGLSLSSSGLISGTPTAGNLAASFTVRATDENGIYVDRSFSITVIVVVQLLSSGNFVVPANVTSIDYLVVAGGGSGSGQDSTNVAGSGGGAGGVIEVLSYAVTPGQSIAYTVGAGASGQQAAADSSSGYRGGNSTFASTTATGGGGGVQWNDNANQRNGGSGGGATGNTSSGTGTTGQGNSGYYPASQYRGGGGGGKAAAATSELGGAGITWNGYSVGGGGSGARGGNGDNTTYASVGYGGGNSGSYPAAVLPGAGVNGTGGGGGGCGASSGATYRGAAGGNGAIYVKYRG